MDETVDKLEPEHCGEFMQVKMKQKKISRSPRILQGRASSRKGAFVGDKTGSAGQKENMEGLKHF